MTEDEERHADEMNIAFQMVAEWERKQSKARIEKLEAGINALVNCQSALPRAALREAAADILDKRPWRTEDQSPLVSQNHALRFRIEKLEAALRSVLQYRLTDETWVKLGFDPKKIRVEFDAARKALEGKDD